MIDCVAIYHLHSVINMSDALGLSLIGQSFMDNVVGAKAVYPFYGSGFISKSSPTTTISSQNIGTFTLAAFYIPMIMLNDAHYAIIPFIIIAPSMDAFFFPMYNASNGSLVSSSTSGSSNTEIRISTSTNSINITAEHLNSNYSTNIQVNGSIVIFE